jgi:ATP-binding cassette, subfamily B, bacterial PglK
MNLSRNKKLNIGITSQLRRLWVQVQSKQRLQVVVLVFLMFGASLSEVLSIGAVIPFLGVLTAPDVIYDADWFEPIKIVLEISSPERMIPIVTLGFIISILISGSMRVCLLWMQNSLGHKVGSNISSSVFEKTINQPYKVHIKRNSSEILAAISTKCNIVVYQTIMPVLVIVSSLLISIFLFFALAIINIQLVTYSICGFAVIYFTIVLSTRTKISNEGKIISLEQDRVLKIVQEGLGGIRDIIIDNNQEFYVNEFKKSDYPLKKAQATIQIIGGIPRYLVESLAIVMMVFFAYSMLAFDAGIASVVPTIGAFALGAQRMLPAIQQIYNNYAYLMGSKENLNDVLQLLEQDIIKKSVISKSDKLTFQEKITLENISFQYDLANKHILQSVDISILKGQKIGIIGQSGGGKSTLIDIIMGLLEPTSGKLIVDGVEINSSNSSSWQKNIAHVPQNIFLVDGSVAKNIVLSTPNNEVDSNLLKNSLRLAGLEKDVELWPLKSDTPVGEGGIGLSGGQRQRIGIARALYKKASILFLDEATSALDNATENSIIQGVSKMDASTTIFIIAHRITTLAFCDYIMEIKDGSISRIVSYEQLMSEQHAG